MEPLSLDVHLPPARGRLLRKPTRLAQDVLSRLLLLRRLQRLHRDLPRDAGPASFPERVCAQLAVTWRVEPDELARIPRQGPVVLVANHPFGGLDGLILDCLLARVRPDYKLLANHLLARIPEMGARHLFVNPFGHAAATAHNHRPLKEAVRWLREAHLLAIFPAGEVASVQWPDARIADPAWQPTAARLARLTGATVVPLHFAGANSPLFQLAGLVHPRLRTALLPRELLNKRRACVGVRIGRPLPPTRLAAFPTAGALTQYLRVRTHALARRGRTAPAVRAPAWTRWLRPRPHPLAAADDAADLAAELAALPADARLLGRGAYEVWCARAAEIPLLLREIGRLRERTFRDVGEGTGRSLDLDRFDAQYHHLFVWQTERRELVGAYRLGLAGELLPARGLAGFYTQTLFRYAAPLQAQLHRSIELGRSFVRAEYQRAYQPLLLLWHGIGQFVVRHPGYVHLFGPVSVSRDYQDYARQLLVAFCRQQRPSPPLSRWIHPRHPLRCPGGVTRDAARLHAPTPDWEAVGELIAEVEPDGKGLPVLLRQYLKLGGEVLACNVDPHFNAALDLLISVDLRRTPPALLARYLGDGPAAALTPPRRAEAPIGV